MRTAITCPLYLEGADPLGNDRLERNIAYLKYYLKLGELRPFESIWLADNGSSERKIHALLKSVHYDPRVHVWRYPDHLSKTDRDCGYIYCWRALYLIRNLIEGGYQRIITIDSDAYITSRKLLDFTFSQTSGWHALWVKRHHFPTAEFHILCQDAFPLFSSFTSVHYSVHNGKLMETTLPFTHIHRDFECDRSGETRDPQTPGQDLYGQAQLSMLPVFKCEE